MDRSLVTRLVGGSPLRTLLWLVALSLVVGFVLDTVGLDPFTLFHRLFYDIERFVDRVIALGFGAFSGAFRLLIVGAVVVVPVWLLLRLGGRVK